MRKIIAVLLGLATGLVLMVLLEELAHALLVGEKVDLSTKEKIVAYVQSAPWYMFACLILIYIITNIVSGFITGWIGKIDKPIVALIPSLMFLVFGLWDQIEIPHPVWFTVLSTFIYVPAGLVGYFMYRKKVKKPRFN